ncbi:hypothetical protein ANN_05815 [Periplaneta americana]|uniref:Small RNA 2'-O-methyltransferase n=1 Tax=Periplaneta americana TaxID=6978 RepID=A0ABQ8TBV0_PERAM|nr:hypothetical protein ANN_05815 [Periplaneta americana]
MIVLFHTFYMVTKYILTIISKSIFNEPENIECEKETSPNFISSDRIIVISEAEFGSDVGIKFYPPVYAQRYLAVKNVLVDERWQGKIRKAEFGFFPYLKHMPGVQEIVTVDIDHDMLEHNCCRAAPLNSDYLNNRQESLTVQVLAGSIGDRDPRLLGTDAVVCIELIEHLYPDTLEAVPFTVFGFIQPLVAIFTTPNSDFNVLFPDFTGFRNTDHKFEWTRAQFKDWYYFFFPVETSINANLKQTVRASNITSRYPEYNVYFYDIGRGPEGTEEYGCCSQMAVFARAPQYSSPQLSDLKMLQSEEKYVLVREYSYPVRVDNRTDEEKILHQAEYYIRVLADNEKYCRDMSIQIPVQDLLPHVRLWCDSVSVLRDILKEAGWEVTEHAEDGMAVVYPYCGEYENSLQDLEDPYSESPGENVPSYALETDEKEDWDTPQPGLDEDSNSVAAGLRSSCSDNMAFAQQENVGQEANKVTFMSSLRDLLHSEEGNSCKSESVDGWGEHGSDCLENTDKTLDSSVQHPGHVSTNLNLADDIDTNLKSERLAEQVDHVICPIVDSFTRHNGNNGRFRFSKTNQNCFPLSVESSEDMDFEKYSKTEALVDHKKEEEQKVGKNISLCSYSDVLDSKVSLLPQNSQSLTNQVKCVQSDCAVINSHSERLRNSPQTVQSSESESVELLYLNLTQPVEEASVSEPVLSQPWKFGSTGSSALESSQDRSIGESSSLDEQNDKAVDSGYPNSFSVQDMDMDLTPEQVDEICSESDDVLTEDCSEESEYCESESSEENDHVDNNEGLLFRFRNEALYDPMALVVENGDVANNNRDGEGNNAVAMVPPPPEPDVLHPVHDELIPLLVAAEDFDNDNDVILPADVQPFPHWLLNLLVLANQGEETYTIICCLLEVTEISFCLTRDWGMWALMKMMMMMTTTTMIVALLVQRAVKWVVVVTQILKVVILTIT